MANTEQALKDLRDWFESQRKAISKGCGSSWDMGQCAEQIEKIDAALTAASAEAATPVAWVRSSDLDKLKDSRVAGCGAFFSKHKTENHTVAIFTAQQTEAPVNVPSGWKLVPHEPTAEMRNEGADMMWDRKGTSVDVWQAMWNAAPAPVQTEAQRLGELQDRLIARMGVLAEAQQSEKDELRESADEWSTPPVRTWLADDAIAKEKAKS